MKATLPVISILLDFKKYASTKMSLNVRNWCFVYIKMIKLTRGEKVKFDRKVSVLSKAICMRALVYKKCLCLNHMSQTRDIFRKVIRRPQRSILPVKK